LIHGEKIGFGSSPEVAASYLAVAAILYFCARRASFAPPAAHHAPPLAEQGRAETA
jgi:AGZA family xanthine/uracil permease-like MFS transporter